MKEIAAIRFTKKNLPKEEFFVSGHRACQGCGEMLAVRLAMKALGRDTIVACATGCIEIVSSPFPETAWEVPWIHVAFENTAAVISGVEAGLKVLMRKGRLKERRIFCVGMAGDGGTADIGIQALSGALERGHDILYLCFDNEAYMNTGIQRSSATPFGAATTTSPPGRKSLGQMTWKKNVPEIAVAHGIPYVATASPAFPYDLMTKVRRGAEVRGPAYIHIYSPCPTGWRCPPDLAIEVARLAVQTGVFPLYEVIEGRYRINQPKGELKPVEEYLKLQGRFRHLDEAAKTRIQERVREEWERLKKKAQAFPYEE